MLTAELLGVNLPRIFLARTPAERVDVVSFEALNTVGFFGGGLLLDKLTNSLLTSPKPLTGKGLEILQLGKSLGLYSMLGSFMGAVPFFRNWLTSKVEHKTDFTHLLQKPRHQKAHPEELAAKRQQYLQRMWQILGAGALGMVGSFALTKAVLNQPRLLERLPNLPKAFKKHWLLGLTNETHQPSLLRIPNLAALTVWGWGSYAGAITASRGAAERREQWIKAASFTACFSVLPPLIGKLSPALACLLKPAAAVLDEKFLANTHYVVKLASQVGLLAASTLGYQKLTAWHLSNKDSGRPALNKADDDVQKSGALSQTAMKRTQPTEKAGLQNLRALNYYAPATSFTYNPVPAARLLITHQAPDPFASRFSSGLAQPFRQETFRLSQQTG